jgi:hypothetical protein
VSGARRTTLDISKIHQIPLIGLVDGDITNQMLLGNARTAM